MTGIVWVVAALAAIALLVYAMQGRLIYFSRPYNSLDGLPSRLSQIEVRTSEGNQTSFYLAPSDTAAILPTTVWVLFGGNASLALDWLDMVERFPEPRTGFLLIDYPGYGLCEGSPTPATILESANAALDGLANRLGLPREALESRVSALGHSLGAAAALEFGTRCPVNRMILVSPFTSLLDMARRSVGIPLCYLLRYNFDNRVRLRDLLNMPAPPTVTIIHGERDEVVPVGMSRALAEEFAGRVEYHEIPRADHNSILWQQESLIFRIMSGKTATGPD